MSLLSLVKENALSALFVWLPGLGIITLTSIHAAHSQPLPQQAPKSYTNLLGMEFELIQPGSMLVGRLEPACPEPPSDSYSKDTKNWTKADYEKCRELAERDARPGFVVKIERAFYIGKYEVTQGQWQKVMGSNPSWFQGNRVADEASLHPVENISWEDAQEFIRRLNVLDTSSVYRLPTEFEWEYAARAGSEELLSWKETVEQAWIQKTDKGATARVGQLKPNAWGLYDMLGNVWEWVEDYHNGKIYPDPLPLAEGKVHVLKGGSFTSDVVNATWFFHGGGPGNGYDVGLRIVREVK